MRVGRPKILAAREKLWSSFETVWILVNRSKVDVLLCSEQLWPYSQFDSINNV